jgi:hypothetical protein
MTDKNMKSQATLEELHSKIDGLNNKIEALSNIVAAFKDMSMAQIEQMIFRMESTLIRSDAGGKPKKVVVKKITAKTEDEKKNVAETYTNTMYWWTRKYNLGYQPVMDCVTADDVLKAEAGVEGIQNKPEGYDRRSAISSALWKGFDKTRRAGELKTMFDNWKKEQAKMLAKDVEKDKNSDEEPDIE